MAEDAGHRGHAAVDGDDRDLGVDGFLQRRRHGVDLVRAQHDALDALGERRLDVGGLLGRRNLAVAFDRVKPCFVASALNAFIMWTKNGKLSPGTETRIAGLSSAKAGAASAIARGPRWQFGG